MKFSKFHIIVLIVTLIWNFSFAQQHTNYNIKSGLPSNHVYRITQDNSGLIWILTDKGIVKYNGDEFKSFTTRQGLPTNDIWGICTTKDAKVWYFSKSSKIGYIKNDSVFAFPSTNEGEILNPLFHNQVNNTVQFSSGKKTYYLNKKNRWQEIKKNKAPGIFYEIIKHKTIVQFNGNKTQDSLLIIGKNQKIINKIKFTKIIKNVNSRGQINDSLFYWLNDLGYVIFNLNDQKLYKRTFKEEIHKKQLKFLRFSLVNDQIQISGSGFVSILDRNYHLSNTVFIPDELQSHFAFLDRSGTIWAATFTNGVYKLPKVNREINYSLENEKVVQLSKVGNDLIASVYDKGFYKYNAKQQIFMPFIKEKGYILNAVRIEPIGRSYYLTGTKIISFQNKTKRILDYTKTSELKVNATARQLVFLNGFLYGNFSSGINKIDPVNLEIIKNYQQVGVYSLVLFNESILIGTPRGLKKLENDSIIDVIFSENKFNNPILKLKKVSHTKLLVCTDGFGAYLTDLNQITILKQSEYLSIQDAFIENDSIWLASDIGVLHYQKYSDEYKLIRIIDERDGLPSKNVNTVAIVNNDIIVGTDNGVAVFSKQLKNPLQLLDIYVERAIYNNQLINDDTYSFNYSTQNNANFTISSIDFSESTEKFTYDYKLYPLHKEWISTTSKSINFTDLPPNNYNLSIRFDSIQKNIEFKIIPLWWQTIWFRILILFLTIAFTAFVLWYVGKKIRLKKNKKLIQEKQLAQIQLKALRSQMNPHFVFNSLAAIQYYINNNEIETSEAYLVKFSKLIRQFFELSKEKDIAISDEIKLLKNYLDIEKLRFKDKLNYKLNIDKNLNIENNTIPTMLLQPIVENAVNHGIFNKVENGTITINFNNISINEISIDIIDDGVGFVKTIKKKGKIRSSNVLKDRLYFLNQSGRWKITYSTREAFSAEIDKGNVSTFIIKKIV